MTVIVLQCAELPGFSKMHIHCQACRLLPEAPGSLELFGLLERRLINVDLVFCC